MDTPCTRNVPWFEFGYYPFLFINNDQIVPYQSEFLLRFSIETGKQRQVTLKISIETPSATEYSKHSKQVIQRINENKSPTGREYLCARVLNSVEVQLI